MRIGSLCMLLALSVCLSQCSIRSIAVQQMGELVAKGVPAFEKDDDLELIAQALPGNIKLLEAMLENDPSNKDIPVILAQMYASYTFAFLEGELENPKTKNKEAIKERVNKFYKRAIGYGERAIKSRSSSCEKSLATLGDLETCLAKLGRDDVPALYWYGFSLATYINQNMDSMGALAEGPKMEKLMNRIVQLDETYNFGTAHLFLMLYYGSRPPMMGGNFAKAEEHYKAIQKIAGPQFLLADVFRARYVLVQQQDKEGFEKSLKAAIAAKAESSQDSRYALYNSLAKSRAKLYLNSVEEYF